jgi:hypothetical protein
MEASPLSNYFDTMINRMDKVEVILIMATKKLSFPDIKNNYWITYFFQKQSEYKYKITLEDSETGNIYYTWNEQEPDIDNSISGEFKYTGIDGNLVCNVICPYLDARLDNTWAESIIMPNSGGSTLGRIYCFSFETYESYIQYNDLLIFVQGVVFSQQN